MTARGLDRRRVLGFSCAAIAITGCASPLVAFAQARTVRIGFLSGAARPPDIEKDRIGGFLAGMRDLGYTPANGLTVEWRFAGGDYARLPALAAELVAAGVDVIVTAGVPPTVAAKKASSTIPIVMGTATDPVGAGLVSSLAKPGGNVTGLSNMANDLGPKHVDLLLSAVPRAGVLGVLIDKGTASHPAIYESVSKAAAARKVETVALEVASAREIEPAVALGAARRAGGLIVPLAPLFNQESEQIARHASAHRLASVAGFAEYAAAGGLMSYGQDLFDQYRRAAFFVDRILKGARPADLPVEQSSVFQLVINLRTAKALNLRMPERLLAMASRVINTP